MLTVEQRTLAETYARYRDDLHLFCKEVMGYTDMNDEHKALCTFLQQPYTKPRIVLMPRYSFKSCIADYGYILWRLTQDDSLRILIYAHSNAQAETFLAEIKHHIQGMKAGSKFLALYGDWESDPKEGTWNQSAITIKVRQHAQDAPSVDTAGLETGKTGTHYDIIIFDDLVVKENTTTPELMQKTKDVYRASLSLLKPGGEVLLIGTRWNFNDLYGEMVELARTTGIYDVFIRKTKLDDGTYPFASIKLDEAFYQRQLHEQGSYMVSCLYQNDPVSDEDAIFKSEYFTFYDPSLKAQPDFLATLFITCCWDPATGEGEDLAALSVVGTDHELNMYLLELVSGKLSTSAQIEQVMSLYAHWGFRTLGVEINGFQRMLQPSLEQRIREERQRNSRFRLFHIEPFTSMTDNSKDLRIRGLQPYHERRAIKLPGERVETLRGPWQRLAHQMLHYTPSHRPAHEDELDSLSMHPQIQQRGERRTQEPELPWSSAAWFEQRQRQQMIESQRRKPRWARESIPPLVFS